MFDMIMGQVFGLLATIATFLSYQANTQKKVLIILNVSAALLCVSYFFLGATSGLVLNIICIIRNLALYIERGKTKATRAIGIVFALAMLGFGIPSWQAWFSLLLILALMANTVFLSLGNPQWLRMSILFTSSMVLIYNILVLSFGGMLSESIAIVSSAIGLFRYRKRGEKPL